MIAMPQDRADRPRQMLPRGITWSAIWIFRGLIQRVYLSLEATQLATSQALPPAVLRDKADISEPFRRVTLMGTHHSLLSASYIVLGGTYRMDVQSAEMAHNVQLLLGPQILEVLIPAPASDMRLRAQRGTTHKTKTPRSAAKRAMSSSPSGVN